MSILAQPPNLKRLEEPVVPPNPVRRYRVPPGAVFQQGQVQYRGGSAVLLRETEAAQHLADGSLIPE